MEWTSPWSPNSWGLYLHEALQLALCCLIFCFKSVLSWVFFTLYYLHNMLNWYEDEVCVCAPIQLQVPIGILSYIWRLSNRLCIQVGRVALLAITPTALTLKKAPELFQAWAALSFTFPYTSHTRCVTLITLITLLYPPSMCTHFLALTLPLSHKHIIEGGKN